MTKLPFDESKGIACTVEGKKYSCLSYDDGSKRVMKRDPKSPFNFKGGIDVGVISSIGECITTHIIVDPDSRPVFSISPDLLNSMSCHVVEKKGELRCACRPN